jgi:organic radical activating enzyme
MHSIYWVVSRDCNQRCRHCYNDSEPGAPGLTLDEVSRCVANFPTPEQCPVEHLLISGGEALAWPELLFHTLAEARRHFGPRTELMLQTNGDLLDEPMLHRLLAAHVTRISIASMDEYHKTSTLQRADYLRDLFTANGLDFASNIEQRPHPRKPQFNIWGMTEDQWVGKLWPRGRARHLNLSQADGDTDFCGIWSGAKNFLDYHSLDCQVNIQLADVYPCCPMTCRPLGDISSEPLLPMLDRLATHPVFQILNQGKPEKLAEYLNLPESHGRERSHALGNHCLWCDEFFTRHAQDLLHQPRTPTTRGRIDLTIQGKKYKGVHKHPELV